MQITRDNAIWGWSRKIDIAPFDQANNKKVPSSSKYTVDGGYDKGMSTLVEGIIRAINDYASIMKGEKEGAIGENGDIYCIERYATDDPHAKYADEMNIVEYNSLKGTFRATTYAESLKKFEAYRLSTKSGDGGTDGTALWLAALPLILQEQEAADVYQIYEAQLDKPEDQRDINVMLRSMGTLCDNIYKRCIDGKIPFDLPDRTGQTPVARITDQYVSMKKVSIKNTLCGEFRVIYTSGANVDYSVMDDITIEKDEFNLPLSRVLSPSEKAAIFVPPTTHKISAEELRICKEVKRCWQKPIDLKVGNILLEGAAGSGKTRLAKVLSYRFGLPYTKVTCSAGMDTDALIGSILPVLNETDLSQFDKKDRELLEVIYQTDQSESVIEALEKALDMPTRLEMFYDPEKSWERLTGKQKENVETLECLDLANAIATKEWQRLINMVKNTISNKKDNSVEYRYYPSEIVRAFQYGYLLEIQEPTMIRDAGLLTVLNSALEMDGTINLPTGVVHRHPDFICVATTNRGYAGCKPLNESFRDRFQHAEKMDLPSEEVMVQRAIAVTGSMDIGLVRSLVAAIRALDEVAYKNSIKGVAGMRSLYYCLDAIKDGMSTEDAILQKVVYKMTTDEDEIDLLMTAIESGDLLIDTTRSI